MGQVRSVMTSLLRSIAMAISTCRRGRSTAAACSVRHFSPAEDDKTGLLVHKAGGTEHGRWVFDYNVARDDDDEAGFLFGHHAGRICFNSRCQRHHAHFHGQIRDLG